MDRPSASAQGCNHGIIDFAVGIAAHIHVVSREIMYVIAFLDEIGERARLAQCLRVVLVYPPLWAVG